ncbi:neprilysin-like isoform X2 [Melanaphis sacchari]|uniref:neprilysin-like isoform X2 n=1 Tax=Melanaphis sacchari TaxID=742174 RepID=UPI000DC14D46|nr:neprilysin-like isoform X2 [Melanaphis sacchari]
MPVADSEYDGGHMIANNHYLRDYHRSTEQQIQQQNVVVVSANSLPPAATGPEVHQALHSMAPPALQQQHRQQRNLQQQRRQQQPIVRDAEFIAVSSRKNRKFQDLWRGRTVLEKWIIFFATVLCCVFLMLTIMKIKGTSSIRRSIDVAAEPCDNFYEFACGKYYRRMDFDKYDNWFMDKTTKISEEITDILEKKDNKGDLQSVKQGRRLYKACLNTDKLNTLQYDTVFKFLNKVGIPKNIPGLMISYYNEPKFNVAKSLALIQRYLGMDIIMQIIMDVNPKTNLSVISVGPVSSYVSTLPEPLYDFHRPTKIGRKQPFDIHEISKDDGFNKRLAIAKVQYMIKIILYLFPEEDFNNDLMAEFCLNIFSFELDLLKKDVDYEKKGEEFTTYGLRNYMYSGVPDPSIETLFDWQTYISYITTGTNVKWSMSDIILVRNPEYFLELREKLLNASEEKIQQLLWWKVVEALVTHTTTQMVELKEEFMQTILPSAKRSTRKEFCTSVVKSTLKLPLAYEFYVRHDLKETTEEIFEMIKQLQDVFKDMISESEWMDEDTKSRILFKLDSIRIGVGYPEIFQTPELVDKKYDYVKTLENEYLQSLLNIRETEINLLLSELGKPVKFSLSKQFIMDPLEVNAFYTRLDNSINIPAGILQLPFYNKGVDVVNYGAIGAIIGHEITHGFDIEGKNYDSYGQKISQWSSNAEREYLRRAMCFVDQYNQFELTPSTRLNGTLTLGENMADNVGLKQSWKAYKLNKIGEGVHLPGLAEYSNDQLFFLSYANVWCRKPFDENEEQIQDFIADDHSPNTARVIGSLRNSPEFAEAWKCPAGSRMNPSKKCSMW